MFVVRNLASRMLQLVYIMSCITSLTAWSLFGTNHHEPTVTKCNVKMTPLTFLRDCSNIGLRSIPYDFFQDPKNTLKLGNNPYVCDCSMVWFLQEPKSNKKNILDINAMTCAEPKHLAGKKISSLTEKDICPSYIHVTRKLCDFIFGTNTLHCTRRLYKVKQIPVDVLDSSYKRIYVAGDYKCDCSMVWFIRKIKDPKYSKLIMHDKERILCDSPPRLRGEYVADLEETSVCGLKENEPCQRNPKPCNEVFSTCKKTSRSYECVDIDECVENKHNCAKGEECINKKNGFTCQCRPKHVKNPNGIGCIVPVDPCSQKTSPCNETTQQCVSGERLGTYTCKDIDECALNKHECHKYAKCTNLSPGYKCRCKDGFVEYNNGRDCRDINECLAKVDCSPDARCINNLGSYECICHPGYHGNGKQCEDINECLKEGFCSPNARCINTKGSFECVCNSGYQGNGKLCSDIDECSTKGASCPVNAKCVNTAGSYKCVCNPGYSWDGERCLDIDECVSGVHTCDKNAICKNLPGNYKCFCKEGFEHFKEGRLCLKEEEEVTQTSEQKSKYFILVGCLVSLVLVAFIIICIVARSRNKKKYQKAVKDEDNTKAEIEQKFIFTKLNDPTTILPSVSVMSEWSEGEDYDEKDYDEDDDHDKLV